MKIYNYVLISLISLLFSESFAQTPCENGMSDIYPCDNVDLLKHFTPAQIGGGNTNDIWGWTDPLDGREYVLLGKTTGTSFFDITDPVNAVYLGTLPKHTTNSTWRSIKVYNNYAFMVSEASGSGMQVFDLTRLRNIANPPVTFTNDAWYGGFSRAHTIAINEETGFAYAAGTNTFSGGLHIINIQDPLNPVLAGDYALDGYTHECQVVSYIGPDSDYQGRQISFNCNEDAVTIVDVTDPTDTQTITINGYPQAEYTHQGWLTEDQRYFLVNDELDEMNNGVNTTTYIWDMLDLDSPLLIGVFVSTIPAIDHNLYIKGNLVYQSNYRGGVRILDAADVANANLSEVGYFDLYPSSNSANFNGTWSNYPFFESGVVAASHIDNGLFLLRPQFLHASLSQPATCATDDIVIDITLEAGFVGPISLNVDGLPIGATATFDENNVMSPNTVQLTISGLPNITETYAFSISGIGSHYTYTDVVDLTLVQADVWYQDADSDGYGVISNPIFSCSPVAGYSLEFGDCNDADVNVNPIAPEVCNGQDDNCNDLIDEGLTQNWYQDADGDGIGSELFIVSCAPSGNYSSDLNTDCDDSNNFVYPGAALQKELITIVMV
jgi:choice-of-anchor B domain-containing protein